MVEGGKAQIAYRLQQLETHFAPVIGELEAVFSPQETIRKGKTNSGGDKMGADRNDYAPFYAEVFSMFSPQVIVEL